MHGNAFKIPLHSDSSTSCTPVKGFVIKVLGHETYVKICMFLVIHFRSIHVTYS